MAIAVPNVAVNLGFLKARHKPRAGVEARTLTDEHRVCGLVQLVLQSLECRDRVGVQVNCSSRAVLRLYQVDGATVEMHLPPGEGVLLRQAHARAD